MAAFPHHREILTLPNGWVVAREEPERASIARPMARTVEMKSEARPPMVSSTIGIATLELSRPAGAL